MSTVVQAVRLSKVYRTYARPWDRLREWVTRRPHHAAFHALDGIDLEVKKGESLGIIGENGAGKSTLLKILSGVTAPTSGQLSVRGQVASLLELGTGFHPEFTGRENIRLNAAMIGLSEAEVERKMPSIIAWSELGAFIDRPVRTYSTGMAMRLGFAIAVQVEPDILIIDEALSVGDGYFQKKCMDRMRQFLDSGRTLLFCSHAMYYLSSFCSQALWLRQGRAEAYGPVDQVVHAYETFLATRSAAASLPEPSAAVVGPARVRSVRFPGQPPGEPRRFRPRERFELEIEWEADNPALEFHLGVGVNAASGIEVCAFATVHDSLPAFTGRGSYRIRLRVPELPFVKGEFTLHVYLLDEAGLHVYDHQTLPGAFSVQNDSYHFGIVDVPHSWYPVDEDAELSPQPPHRAVRTAAPGARA